MDESEVTIELLKQIRDGLHRPAGGASDQPVGLQRRLDDTRVELLGVLERIDARVSRLEALVSTLLERQQRD